MTTMIQNLTDTLNAPDNLNALSTQVTSLVNSAFDDVLGGVPASGLVRDPTAAGTNPIDQYVFQRVHTALATPGTDYYLPKTVLFFRNPQLEPYTAASISIPDQNYSGINFRNITISNLVVSGASNAVLPAGQMTLSNGVVEATVRMSTLSPGPVFTGSVDNSQQTLTVPNPPLTINGDFSITPGASPNPITGTITITVSSSQVQTAFAFSGADISSLELTFNSLTASAASSAITVSVNLGDAGPFGPLVNAAVNQDSFKQSALSALNGEVAGQLPAISQTATADVRALAQAQLAG